MQSDLVLNAVFYIIADLLGLARIVELQPVMGYVLVYGIMTYLILRGVAGIVKVITEWHYDRARLNWDKEKRLIELLGIKYINRKYPEFVDEKE